MRSFLLPLQLNVGKLIIDKSIFKMADQSRDLKKILANNFYKNIGHFSSNS